jgi:hypothetical protein
MSVQRHVTSDSYGALCRLQLLQFNLYEVKVLLALVGVPYVFADR